jgi:DNA-binding beta-propeller fold protein YncE
MRTNMQRRIVRLPALLFAALAAVAGCDDDDDGAFPGASDFRVLVATRDPDALELFDAQTLDPALDTPQGLPDTPLEARADVPKAHDQRSIFVTSFEDAAALAFDSELFEEVPASDMEPAGFIDFDGENRRIYLASDRLAFFDARDFSPLGFPPIDLRGDASDVVYDPATDRIFVAVSASRGPLLRVYDADDLSEVPPSPLELSGDEDVGTGDLLLVDRAEGDELFVLLPEAEQLAGIDPVSLRPLPRTPVALRISAREVAIDRERERIYAASQDGQLESIGATDFSLTGGFPRQIAQSVVDLAFDPETERLFAADFSAEEVVVLDALTLDDEPDSPIELEGRPVSVEILNLEQDRQGEDRFTR